ncbi:intraflagellar transport protein 81 homolog [Phlebotomus argentipes]|uniref:intraflagellar transport protein 81 homolog n=1 Tax=Phlebotomus argentipes TaxID=94469 RepID=UPI002892D79F|nr:intraflagellar transport protein 81 homolog [Phlebotomus argentipes]
MEDLKELVNKVNSLLGTNYNMISFDSLSAEGLIQVLVDVLSQLQCCEHIEVRGNDFEEVNKKIIECLKRIQYRPREEFNNNPEIFRRGLANGEKKVIYPIISWISTNKETVKEVAYLSKYLMPLNLPIEARAIPEISRLWDQYQTVMEDFVGIHKAYSVAQGEGNRAKELKNDIGAIETEIENVKKRLERTQLRLDKIPQQELFLEAGRALRIEKDRNKELEAQLEEQKKTIERNNLLHSRLQKELSTAQMATASTGPKNLLDTLVDETQVLDFMLKQKLPVEFKEKQDEILLMQRVLDEPKISEDYITDLNRKIEDVNQEVQGLVEARMHEHSAHNDTLGPFKQQAAMVRRNKEVTLEQLDKMTKELREVNTTLEVKQKELQDTVGEVILRGDELKNYVNTLRAKSSVYKQHRAELASLQSEEMDLQKTLDNLKSQDPSLQATLSETGSTEEDILRPNSPQETHGVAELSRLVEGLSRATMASRERLVPLSHNVRPLREKILELKDIHESKKQAYDALSATLKAESASMQKDVNETETLIGNYEEEWRELQLEQERISQLLKSIGEEGGDEKTRSSVAESLTHQIKDEERSIASLNEENQRLLSLRDKREKQMELWGDLNKLLQVKIQCQREKQNQGIGGILHVDRGAETFTLQ